MQCQGWCCGVDILLFSIQTARVVSKARSERRNSLYFILDKVLTVHDHFQLLCTTNFKDA
jgi:hypothetical protein